MVRVSRSADDASSRVLNSLQLAEIHGRRAVKHRVAVVESPVGRDVPPNVTQHPQVEVGRLADAVDVFVEGQSIVDSHSDSGH